MKPSSKSALVIAMALTMPCVAADDSGSDLTTACEEALALSALPARLRDLASVYTLTDNGFELTRESDGEFTCIVERNHESAVIPQCADAAGADTVIQGIIKKSGWALAGVPPAERKTRFVALAEAGELRAPERAGVNYMMSDFNFVWNAQSEDMMRIPPHVMYYAPGVTNEDIGGSFSEAMTGNRGTPYIVEPGIHGYIVSMVEKASDSSAVLASCEGQLRHDEAESIGG